ncbi:hypothetical protein NLG42_10525 [Flavobacterium plurextorum]|uniref:hypothetical protein n=1 Tax=Flavobacterium TaxID=237 RepID=UPI00214DEFB8|nr:MULTISPECIES: hypothetical protein [Flavobacterium]UUW11222.1 hypothetical protein NLG42_10525 [Flavobacterium plurextorum]
MEFKNLWEKLPVNTENLNTFKRDISDGKVPELPFFIVDQIEAKQQIGDKLKHLDGRRLQTNVLIALYGNGKTNLLKYLKLFFKENKAVDVIYTRADKDRTDLGLIFLTHIENNYLEFLADTIVENRANLDVKDISYNFEENFAEIKDYVNKLFDPSMSREQIEELLYMGTGRIYTRNYFTKYGIPQIQAFNRREVLVVLLNILSSQNKYIIFCVDEIEKIVEKSKIRFNHFLTSYREIIDLANKIHGHYILTSITDTTGGQAINLANQALYTRIEKDIISLKSIEEKADYLQLIGYLDELFDTNKKNKYNEIFNKVNNKSLKDNRSIIREIVHLLDIKDLELPIQSLLENAKLYELFLETEKRLDIEDTFKRLHQKFFDPLDYYLESVKGRDINDVLKRRERIFIDKDLLSINLFIFNSEIIDIEEEYEKINNLLLDFNDYNIVIFAPKELELTNSYLENFKLDTNGAVEIIDYSPEDLFTLLVMFRENFDKQNILNDVISSYSNLKL